MLTGAYMASDNCNDLYNLLRLLLCNSCYLNSMLILTPCNGDHYSENYRGLKILGDHLQQKRINCSSHTWSGRPPTVRKVAVDGPEGPLTVDDQLWHDRLLNQQSVHLLCS